MPFNNPFEKFGNVSVIAKAATEISAIITKVKNGDKAGASKEIDVLIAQLQEAKNNPEINKAIETLVKAKSKLNVDASFDEFIALLNKAKEYLL